MIDVVLLEIEGVLFDTRELRRISLQDALLGNGLTPLLDPDLVDGRPARQAAASVLSEEQIAADEVLLDLIAVRAERSFSARLAMNGAALRDGARDFVREASATARLAVVTRARRVDAEALLRLAAISEHVAMIVAAEDVLDAKPARAVYAAAIERLRRQRPVAESAMLALEDGVVGIRAAHAAGLRCIAVGPLSAHEAMEADAYVASISGHTTRSLERLLSRAQEHQS